MVLTMAMLLPFAVWSAPPTVELKSLLSDALRLVYAGKATQAYQLLAPVEDRFAGYRDYDYLLGLAALDSGDPELAVFALQRALAVDPRFSGARMDLARAYFVLGQYAYAQEQFQILLAQDPPKKIVDTVHRYQQDIDRRQRKTSLHVNAYAQTAAGYDSNANSATDEDTFLGFRLSDESKRTASPYESMQTGVSMFAPMGDSTQFLAALNMKRRVNNEAAFINSTVYDGNMSLRQRLGEDALQLDLSGAAVNVAGDANSRIWAGVLTWSHSLFSNYLLDLGGRYAHMRYPLVPAKDVDQILWSLRFARTVARPLFSTIGVQVNGGRDFREGAGTSYEKRFHSARIVGLYPFASYLGCSVALGYANSDYLGLSFGRKRADSQRDASLDLRWSLSPAWVLHFQVLAVSNKSNIKIFQYDKTDYGLGLRWNFLK